MTAFIRIAMVIFVLQIANPSFAGDKPDKPLWAIDIKSKRTQKDQFYYLHELSSSASNISVQFTHDDQVLITFFRYGEFTASRKTDVKVSKTTTFVALFLHGETGSLIRRVEWSVEINRRDSEINVCFTHENDILITFFRHEEHTDDVKTNVREVKKTFVALLLGRETVDLVKRAEWSVQDSKKFHFYVFPQDGYLVRTNDTLHALDSSLSVINSKALELLPQNHQYNIVIPGSGYFFAVEQLGKEKNYEIIDWRTGNG
jgi:hypothetical protein